MTTVGSLSEKRSASAGELRRTSAFRHHREWSAKAIWSSNHGVGSERHGFARNASRRSDMSTVSGKAFQVHGTCVIAPPVGLLPLSGPAPPIASRRGRRHTHVDGDPMRG